MVRVAKSLSLIVLLLGGSLPSLHAQSAGGSSANKPQTAAPALQPAPQGASESEPAGRTGDAIEIAVRGVLRGQQMAIGGETTGTTITAKGIVFEVELGDSPRLARAAQQFDGQQVWLQGSLDQRETPERGKRWVITADRLVQFPDTAKPTRQKDAEAKRETASDGGAWWTPFDRSGLTRQELRESRRSDDK